jgi:uncharacterized membrane protein
VNVSLEGEDAKLVILARAARIRGHALDGPLEGAALRDTDGRTYTAATVAHSDPSLSISALRGAVSAAVSSGARSFEAGVVVSETGSLGAADLAVLAAFGADVPVHLVDPAGAVVATRHT